MRCIVRMDSTPEGVFPNEVMEFEVIGSVVRTGTVEYGFDGSVAYHNNVVDYFRACASAGKIALVFSANRPLIAAALHRLFSLKGKRVRKALVMNQRDDNTTYTYLELDSVRIAAVFPIDVSRGTLHLVEFQAAPDHAGVQFGDVRYGAQGRL